MGFIREAFKEGYNPASMPTIVQINMPQKSHAQGNTNPVLSTSEKILPIRIPRKLPKTAPSKLMMMDSYKKLLPDAFLSSADGFYQSDFFCSFRYRYQHDIH